MPGFIKADYGTMDSIASYLEDNAEKIEEELAKVHKEIEEHLREAWEGGSYDAFLMRWDQAKPYTDNTVLTLREMARQVRLIGQDLLRVDSEIAAKF